MPRDTQKPVTTTISIDPKLYKLLKHLAVEQETTVRELIRTSINEFLKRRRVHDPH